MSEELDYAIGENSIAGTNRGVTAGSTESNLPLFSAAEYSRNTDRNFNDLKNFADVLDKVNQAQQYALMARVFSQFRVALRHYLKYVSTELMVPARHVAKTPSDRTDYVLVEAGAIELNRQIAELFVNSRYPRFPAQISLVERIPDLMMQLREQREHEQTLIRLFEN